MRLRNAPPNAGKQCVRISWSESHSSTRLTATVFFAGSRRTFAVRSSSGFIVVFVFEVIVGFLLELFGELILDSILKFLFKLVTEAFKLPL
jgi:hypothetical protein